MWLGFVRFFTFCDGGLGMQQRRFVHVVLSAVLVAGAALLPSGSTATPVWTPSATLAPGAAYVAVASNAAGRSVAVWIRQATDTRSGAVLAASRTGNGPWSAPRVLSETAGHASYEQPQVVLDPTGRAAALWVTTDPSGMDAPERSDVHVMTQDAGGAWFGETTLSTPQTALAASGQSLTIDAAGTVSAAWAQREGTVCTPLPCTIPEIDVVTASRPLGGAWSGQSVAVSHFAGSPALSVAPDGSLDLVAVRRTGGTGTPSEVVATRRPSGGAWASAQTLGTDEASTAVAPRIVSDATGTVTAIWSGVRRDRVLRARCTTRRQRLGQPDHAGPGHASDGPGPDAEGNARAGGPRRCGNRGLEPLSPHRHPFGGAHLRRMGRAGHGGEQCARDDTERQRPRPRPGRQRGRELVGPRRRHDGHARRHRPSGGSWESPVTLATTSRPGSTPRLSSTAPGRFHGLLPHALRRSHVRPGGRRHRPTARTTAPVRRSATSESFRVAWTSTDSQAGVAGVDVRRRAATWRGTLGPWSTWKSGTTASSATYAGVQARTYCFSVRAADRVGLVGAWSAPRCTSTPVDDRVARVSSGWRRTKSSGSFRGTETTTSKHGARLALAGGTGTATRWWPPPAGRAGPCGSASAVGR